VILKTWLTPLPNNVNIRHLRKGHIEYSSSDLLWSVYVSTVSTNNNNKKLIFYFTPEFEITIVWSQSKNIVIKHSTCYIYALIEARKFISVKDDESDKREVVATNKKL